MCQIFDPLNVGHDIRCVGLREIERCRQADGSSAPCRSTVLARGPQCGAEDRRCRTRKRCSRFLLPPCQTRIVLASANIGWGAFDDHCPALLQHREAHAAIPHVQSCRGRWPLSALAKPNQAVESDAPQGSFVHRCAERVCRASNQFRDAARRSPPR